MEISWGSILTVVGATGVFTALLNQGLGWLREWWAASSKKRAHAGYLALRLAVLLESYASACSDFVWKNGNAYHHPGEEFPNWETSLPELPPYREDDEGWRAINRQLAGRALKLRNRVYESQSIVASTIEFKEDELGETLDEEAAARGLEAWELAVELRRMHKVEAVDTVWDFPEMLKNTLRKARRKKEENRESHARMWERIGTGAEPSKPVKR